MPIPAEHANPPAEPGDADHGEHDAAKVRHLHAVHPQPAGVPEPPASPASNAAGEPAAPLPGLGTARPEVEDPTQPIPVVIVDDDPAPVPQPGPVALKRTAGAAAAWAKALCDPQSGLWQDRQPSLAEHWRRYRSGAQLPERGVLRRIGMVLGLVSFGIHAAAETVKFLTGSNVKLLVTATVVGLALLWIALS
uniref:hypothetical protein n=1 Tax=Amycolatopsis sp. CA-096443 TaxID=3239919 RepID=UPI003F4971DD